MKTSKFTEEQIAFSLRVILKKREKVRKETMKTRRELNQMAMLQTLPNAIS